MLYKPTAADTMLSMYLADPALAGGVVGGILFGLLTVYELDRTERSRVGMLMDAAVSPPTMALVRLPAWPLPLSWVWASPCWFGSPISRELIGSVFGGTDYLLSICCSWGWPCGWPFWRRPPPISSPGALTCPWSSLPPSPP